MEEQNNSYNQPNGTPPNAPQNPQTQNPNPPMNWFKFLVYFALFAWGILSIINGIGYITGQVYVFRTQLAVEDLHDLYAFFNGLKTVDVIYGIALLFRGILLLYARHTLSRYYKEGPRYLTISFIYTIVMELIYTVWAGGVMHVNLFDASTIIGIVFNIVLIVVNNTYFSKRQHMFH